jgi:putative cardiolipin synthase
MTEALARICGVHPGQSGMQLLDDGPAALAVRIALVRRAQTSIDVQYYIWRDDAAGRLLLEELVAAAARGVRVRLLLDDFGSAGMDALLANLPGVAVRLFNPARLRWPRWPNLLFDFPRLNRRMHNKSLTVDGIATVVGGRNVADEYFDAGHPALAADLDVLGIGTIAGAMAADFARYWESPAAIPIDRLARAGLRPPPTRRSCARSTDYLAAACSPVTQALIDGVDDFTWADVVVLSDPPGKIYGEAAEAALLLPQLLAALAPVRRRLLLVSAYFIPTEAWAALLGGLARQGVQVEALTNSLMSSDVALVHAWYAPWRRRLLAAGVRLWEMRGQKGDRVTLGLVPRSLRRRPDATSFFRNSASALHAKTLVSDGRWLFVGSMNLDPRSWRLNTELGFLIDSSALAGRLEAALDEGLPRFAWRVEEADGGLGWRQGDQLIQPEPGTNGLRRLVFRLLGMLPLGRFF